MKYVKYHGKIKNTLSLYEKNAPLIRFSHSQIQPDGDEEKYLFRQKQKQNLVQTQSNTKAGFQKGTRPCWTPVAVLKMIHRILFV